MTLSRGEEKLLTLSLPPAFAPFADFQAGSQKFLDNLIYCFVERSFYVLFQRKKDAHK